MGVYILPNKTSYSHKKEIATFTKEKKEITEEEEEEAIPSLYEADLFLKWVLARSRICIFATFDLLTGTHFFSNHIYPMEIEDYLPLLVDSLHYSQDSTCCNGNTRR